jgi:hypothetical protein
MVRRRTHGYPLHRSTLSSLSPVKWAASLFELKQELQRGKISMPDQEFTAAQIVPLACATTAGKAHGARMHSRMHK